MCDSNWNWQQKKKKMSSTTSILKVQIRMTSFAVFEGYECSRRKPVLISFQRKIFSPKTVTN